MGVLSRKTNFFPTKSEKTCHLNLAETEFIIMGSSPFNMKSNRPRNRSWIFYLEFSFPSEWCSLFRDWRVLSYQCLSSVVKWEQRKEGGRAGQGKPCMILSLVLNFRDGEVNLPTHVLTLRVQDAAPDPWAGSLKVFLTVTDRCCAQIWHDWPP